MKTLVLTDEPPAISSEIDVRRIETLEDFLVAREVQWEAFDVPPERRELQQAHLEEEFAERATTASRSRLSGLPPGRGPARATA